MEALASGAIRVLTGQEQPKIYSGEHCIRAQSSHYYGQIPG